MSVTADLRQAHASTVGSLDVEKLKQEFAENGYLVFRDVVSKEQLSELRARIADEFDRQKQSGRLFSGGGLISAGSWYLFLLSTDRFFFPFTNLYCGWACFQCERKLWLTSHDGVVGSVWAALRI